MTDGKIYELKLTRRDANALLGLIAAATDGRQGEREDVAIGGYLADRIIRLVHAGGVVVDPRTTDCCAYHRTGGNLDFKCR